MNLLQVLSILLEVIAIIFGVIIATTGKKIYGWLIALTFFIYVFNDLSTLVNLNIAYWFMRILYFVATVSVVTAIYMIYKDLQVGDDK